MEWSFFSSKIGATALAALEPVIERWNACFQTWLLLAARRMLDEACECQL